MTGYISRTMKDNHKLFFNCKNMVFKLTCLFEWSENETHASEIREYLLTPQTKSLEILNLSCLCFSPSHLEMGS